MTCLRRGPLIYCLEQIDHPEAPLGLLRLPREAELRATLREDLFGGVVTVVGQARALRGDASEAPLYSSKPLDADPAEVSAIPYFLWNNRGPNRMQVWVPEL